MFSTIAVITVAATAFRVVTAPERVRARQEVARQACLQRGGAWVEVDHRYVCSPPPGLPKS